MKRVATVMFEQGANGVDLSRLNEAEREVLNLLAGGHTAKSIANELGSTPAAVNERLREARRKTGVGSSRELARLLKSQENRHDEMGVGSAIASTNAVPQSIAKPWRRHLGALSMLTIFVAAAAGAAALMNQNSSTKEVIDPLIGEPMVKFQDPAELHARVRAEEREAAWAGRTEKAIRDRVLQIPLIGKGGNELRVTCATTLCEISGSIIEPASQAEREDQNSRYNQTIKDLQVSPFRDDLRKIGLKSETGLFTGGKGKPDRAVFLLYYSRVR